MPKRRGCGSSPPRRPSGTRLNSDQVSYPATVDWQGSRNLAEARLLWPAPHRFQLFGLETFGYSDSVLLPELVRPEKPGEPMSLRANLRYLVCDEICIPYEAALSLDLPAGPAAPAPEALLIDRAIALVPGDGQAVGLALESVAVEGDPEAPTIAVTVRTELMVFDSPDLILEGPPGFGFAAPEIPVNGRRASFRVAVTPPEGGPPLEATPITFTLVDGDRALETTRVPTAGESGAIGMAAALLAAFIGGFVPNFMPCVLPVVTLKLGNLLGHGGAESMRIRRDRGGRAELVCEGRAVLVDVTADRCVTCLANKQFVLDSAEICDRLGDEVTALRADWTRPDPAIQDYLARFGRYGIPFGIVYGPRAPAGIVLPELLTKKAVLDAIAAAGD